MIYKKGTPGGYFQKGVHAFARGVKGVATVADHPITSAILSVAQPELGAGLATLKASRVLEKLKK